MGFMRPEVLKSRVVTLTDVHGESTILPWQVMEGPERTAALALASGQLPCGTGFRSESAALLQQFQESPWPLASVEISDGEVWLGRMSAPGYLDCTPWEWATNKRELLRSLRG